MKKISLTLAAGLSFLFQLTTAQTLFFEEDFNSAPNASITGPATLSSTPSNQGINSSGMGFLDVNDRSSYPSTIELIWNETYRDQIQLTSK